MKIVPFYKVVGLALEECYKGKLSDSDIRKLEEYIHKEKPDWALTFNTEVKNILVDLYPDVVEKTEEGIKEKNAYLAYQYFFKTKDREIYKLVKDFRNLHVEV